MLQKHRQRKKKINVYYQRIISILGYSPRDGQKGFKHFRENSSLVVGCSGSQQRKANTGGHSPRAPEMSLGGMKGWTQGQAHSHLSSREKRLWSPRALVLSGSGCLHFFFTLIITLFSKEEKELLGFTHFYLPKSGSTLWGGTQRFTIQELQSSSAAHVPSSHQPHQGQP